MFFFKKLFYKIFFSITTVICAFFLVFVYAANEADKDPSFATSVSGLNSFVTITELQPDGKLVVGGNFTTYTGMPMGRLLRLNVDGSRDTTFDVGSGFNNDVSAIYIQDDGKIVIGGLFTTYKGVSANYILRLNADGSRDTTFDIGSGFNASISSITKLTNQNMLVLGTFTGYKGTSANRVILLQADGSRDTSMDFGSGFDDITSAVVIQPDGKLIIAGQFTTYKGVSSNDVVRLNPDGSKDTSFNTLAGFDLDKWIRDLTLQDDGKLFVLGAFTAYQGVSANRIIRLNSDGTRDYSFDIGSGFNVGIATSALLQPYGRILVGGSFTAYKGVNVNYLIRLNSDGSKDTSFDIGSGFSWSIRYMNYQPDGKILLAGVFQLYRGVSTMYVVRFYGDSVILPNSSNTGAMETAFTDKGYKKTNGNLLGSKRISLGETNGKIPMPLYIENKNILLSLPANTQFKKADNLTNYSGDIYVPTNTFIASVAGKSVINSFAVGSQYESLKLSGGVATLLVPVPSKTVGDWVQIYSSEDNGANRSPHIMTNTISYNGQSYVSFTSNHFSDFALVDGIGSFTINNDVASTTSQNVTLNISTTPAAEQMRFSNDGFSRSTLEPYTTSKSRTLSAGYGTKTVYVEFDIDGDGISDVEASDSILYSSTNEPISNGGTVIGNISLEITKSVGSCSYGTSLYLGSHAAQFAAYTMTGTNFSPDGGITNTVFTCSDTEGNAHWTMTLQANSDLSNGVQSIPKDNVFMIASSNYLSVGSCTTGANQTEWTEIGNNPGTILNKVGTFGDICTISTDIVNLAVHIPENQAVGVYTGTLVLTMPF